MCLSVISKPQQRGGLKPHGLSSDLKKFANVTVFNICLFPSVYYKVIAAAAAAAAATTTTTTRTKSLLES